MVKVLWIIVALNFFVCFVGCSNKADMSSKSEDFINKVPFINSDKMDFEGKKFVIYMFDKGFEDESNKKIFDIVAKRNNISDIVFDIDETYMQFNSKLTTKVLSQSAPNIVNTFTTFYITAAQKNLLEPVTDFVDDLLNKSSVFKQKFSKYAYDNGEYYGVNEGGFQYLEGIYYNPKMIENAGLTCPTELYINNKWTFDKFLEYCRKLTMDTNGDGQIDQWGLAASGAFATGYADLGNLITANGAPLYVKDNKTNNYLNNMIIDKKAWNALDFITTLYGNPTAANPRMNCEKAVNLFKENKIAFLPLTKGCITTNLGYKTPTVFEKAIFIGFPKGPDATDETYHTIRWLESMTAVGAGNKNPYECLRIMEQLYLGIFLNDIGALDKNANVDMDIVQDLASQLKNEDVDNNLQLTSYSLITSGGDNPPENYDKIIKRMYKESRSYMLSGQDNYRLNFSDIVMDARYSNQTPAAATLMRSGPMQEMIDKLFNQTWNE